MNQQLSKKRGGKHDCIIDLKVAPTTTQRKGRSKQKHESYEVIKAGLKRSRPRDKMIDCDFCDHRSQGKYNYECHLIRKHYKEAVESKPPLERKEF